MTQFVNARVHLKENATLGFGVLHMDPETAESNKENIMFSMRIAISWG